MSDREILGYYVVPFVKDGLDVIPHFLNAKKLVRCENCKHYLGEDRLCDKHVLVPFGRFYCYYAEADHE